jgi:signal transduction histidine kinase
LKFPIIYKLSNLLILLVIPAFCLVTINGRSQELKVTHKIFGKNEGVLLDNISDLAFDDEGFLWLAGSILDTREIIADGKKLSLQRFNGSTFHEISIPEKFGVKSIKKLHKRHDGTFILRANRGKYIHFDPYTTNFEQLKLDSQYLSSIFLIDGKEYFLGQQDRTITLFHLEENLTATALFSFTSAENKFELDNSSQVIKLHNNWLIGHRHFAIKVFTLKGEFVKEISQNTTNTLVSNSRILWIDEVFDLEGRKVVAFSNNPKLYYIDETKLEFLPINNEQKFPVSSNIKYVTDMQGKGLLVREFDGTFQLENISNDFTRTLLYTEQLFDSPVALQPVSQNLQKDLWVGTSTGELHYFKFPNKNITKILPNFQFRALTPVSENTYLLATEENGWHLFDKVTGTTQKILFKNQNDIGFPNNSRNFIKYDGAYWSNSGSGMVRADLKNKETDYYSYYPITSLEQINDSMVLCGTNKYHILQFNLRTRAFNELLRTDTLNIHDLAYNSEKQLLGVATSQGFLTYHLSTQAQTFYNLPAQLEDPYLLMVDYMPEHGFILGSRKGHIVVFDEVAKTFKSLYKDALGAGIATILPRGDIWWVNTFNGYVRWDRKKNRVIRLSTKNGFTHNEANRYSALDTGKEFFVGSMAGLNYFNPENLIPEENTNELKLLKVRSYDKAKNKIVDVLDRSLFSESPTITLPAEHKELQIEYALTHNVENRPHSFRYRIDEEDWVSVQQEQKIRFPNLAAGMYRLQIEALDFSGNKIGEALQIAINSRSFFYRTWWFYLVAFVLVSTLLFYLLDKAREKQKLQEKFALALLLSQEKERNHIARELHDSVGQQLTLIKKKTQQKGEDDLTVLTNAVLEEVRAISRGLYPANLKVLGLSQSIEQLIYDLDEKFETFFSVEVINIDSFFNEVESLNLYRFVQECINNSMKHSNASAVSVEITKTTATVHVEISDNGNGFDVNEAQSKNTLGLKTLSERIKIIGGTFEIKSRSSQGTTTIAIIPIK